MTELAIRADSLPDKIQYADRLACSGLLPAQFQDKPANVLWAIEYGETLGITAMAAITGIHVIEKKPSASAGLIGGLVRRAGHKLRVTGDNKSATAQIIRSDDPDYVFEVTFTIEDARIAGLANKAVWKNYPAAMLKARAISQVARDACEEILFGLHYTPEELGADVDADGNPVERRAERQRPVMPAPDHWSTPEPAPTDLPAATPAATPADDGIEDAEVVGETPESAPPSPLMPLATKDQLTKIAILLAEKRGLSSNKADRDACVAACAKLVNRAGTLKSRSELTKSEASSVIEALNAETSKHPPLPEPAAPVPLEDNPVRDVLIKLIAEAQSPAMLADAGRDIANELTRGNITPAEADMARAAWKARNGQLKAEHAAMAGATS